MAIFVEALKGLLCSAIHGKDTPLSAQTAVANTISSYLNANLEAKGVYSGIIAGSPPVPDPLAGLYIYKVFGCVVDPNQLISAANGGTFLDYLASCIQAMVSLPTDEGSKITIPPLVFPPVVLAMNTSGCQNYQDSMGVIAMCIVNGIKALVPVGGSPANSVSGGVGALVPVGYL
jgi:hypothetical protein